MPLNRDHFHDGTSYIIREVHLNECLAVISDIQTRQSGPYGIIDVWVNVMTTDCQVGWFPICWGSKQLARYL